MKAKIKDNWYSAGRTGTVINHNYRDPYGTEWTPMQWDNEDSPDWHKTRGLDFIEEKNKK
jgi:hypothetical protein